MHQWHQTAPISRAQACRPHERRQKPPRQTHATGWLMHRRTQIGRGSAREGIVEGASSLQSKCFFHSRPCASARRVHRAGQRVRIFSHQKDESRRCGFGLRACSHFSSVLSLIRSLRRTRSGTAQLLARVAEKFGIHFGEGRHIDLVAAQCERALPVFFIAATPSISSPKMFLFPITLSSAACGAGLFAGLRALPVRFRSRTPQAPLYAISVCSYAIR